MNAPKITVFMLVTNRDALIADYAVKSYNKVHDEFKDELPFVLYINCATRRTNSERSALISSRPSMSTRSRSRGFSLAEVGAECKSDRHFEKLNNQFCSGHFAPIVVVPLARGARSRRALEDQRHEPKSIALRRFTRLPRQRGRAATIQSTAPSHRTDNEPCCARWSPRYPR